MPYQRFGDGSFPPCQEPLSPEKWPHDKKHRGVLMTGETKRRIGKKDQKCCIVRIAEIDDGTEFFISK